MKRAGPKDARVLQRRPDRHARSKQKRARQIIAAQVRKQRRNPTTLAGKPALTRALASDFAKLLASGVDAMGALRYCATAAFDRMTDDERGDWLNEWAGDRLVLHAINDLNGGEWHHLESERRLEIALDKHLCELAFMLYTTNYRSAEGTILRKLDSAATRLMTYLTDDHSEEGKGNSGWRGFIDDVMKQFESATSPPTLPVLPAEAVKNPETRES